MIKHKRRKPDDKSSNDIRPQYSSKACATAEYGHKLRLVRHFGRKKNHGDKSEHRTELVSVIRNEHQVIIKNNFFKRNMLSGKCLNFILYIENDKYEQDKGNGKNEGL